ncbi:MAG: DUF1579 family protein [Phycisphaeraceae bacterium]|nr:DUF1579 family protein [Phycisphaeraceae bacterium]
MASRKRASVLVGAGMLAGLLAGVVIAQPANQEKPDKRAIYEAVQKMSAPGPEHKYLEPFVGSFTQEILYEAGGGPPVTIEGVATGKWVLGDRFVQMNANSTPREEMRFESINFFGYDTGRKKYTAIGLDTGGTYAVFAEGDYEPRLKTWTLEGETEEPGVGRLPFRFVLQVMPDKSIVHEVLFKLPGSEEYKQVAKTVYRRK